MIVEHNSWMRMLSVHGAWEVTTRNNSFLNFCLKKFRRICQDRTRQQNSNHFNSSTVGVLRSQLRRFTCKTNLGEVRAIISVPLVREYCINLAGKESLVFISHSLSTLISQFRVHVNYSFLQSPIDCPRANGGRMNRILHRPYFKVKLKMTRCQGPISQITSRLILLLN